MSNEHRSIHLRGHALIDARSLALGELTAQRLREQPAKLDAAKAILGRWRRICAPNVQAALSEWQSILDAGLEATIAVLTGRDERCVRLRQSAPFAGESLVSREERNALWRRYTTSRR